MFNTAIETLKERWQSILAAIAAPTIVLLILLMVLVPVMIASVVPGSASTSASFSTSSSTQSFSTSPTVDPMTGAVTAPAGLSQAQESGSTPGVGALVVVLAVMAVIGLFAVMQASIGVYAAAGLDWLDAIKAGARTSPHVVVQTLILGWKPIATYVGMVVSVVLLGGLGFLVAVPLGIATMVLSVRAGAFCMVAMGAIAHGHVSYSPTAAREAIDGRAWQVTGVGFVGTLAGGAASMVPFLGPLFLSSFMSAMWQEFGEDGAGPGARSGTDPIHGEMLAAPYAPPAAANAVQHLPPSAAAVAATVSAPQAEPAPAPALAVGPSWQGIATATEPCGSWVQLAAPAMIALQVQWTTGSAPALHLADSGGAWTTPATQPATSGDAIWVQLPAGMTWVALMPSEPQGQQLWVATMLPPGSAQAQALAS